MSSNETVYYSRDCTHATVHTRLYTYDGIRDCTRRCFHYCAGDLPETITATEPATVHKRLYTSDCTQATVHNRMYTSDCTQATVLKRLYPCCTSDCTGECNTRDSRLYPRLHAHVPPHPTPPPPASPLQPPPRHCSIIVRTYIRGREITITNMRAHL